MLRRLAKPFLVLAVAGVAIAVFDLAKGIFVDSSTGAEKALYAALAVGLLVLAAPIIRAARGR